MDELIHGLAHVGLHVCKEHSREITAGITGTVGTAIGAGLNSVGLTGAGTAVTTAASGALATAGTAVTTFATTVVAPVAATVAPLIVIGGVAYGAYKLLSD